MWGSGIETMSCSSITREPGRNTDSLLHPRPLKPTALGLGSPQAVMEQLPGSSDACVTEPLGSCVCVVGKERSRDRSMWSVGHLRAEESDQGRAGGGRQKVCGIPGEKDESRPLGSMAGRHLVAKGTSSHLTASIQLCHLFCV